MNIPSHLKDARLNMTRAAEVVSMNVGHLRRLVRRGVFPKPKRTSKGMPFFDYRLLVQISTILRTGVGSNKEEIAFYSREPTSAKKRKPQSKRRKRQSPSLLIASVIEGCKQLGIAKDKLKVEAVKQIVADEFGVVEPALREVIPIVARRLLKDDG